MSAFFCIFGRVYLALGANPLSNFFGQGFFENYAKLRFLRALD